MTRALRITLAVIVALFAMWRLARAEDPGSWINYQNNPVTGASCCGYKHDCWRIDATAINRFGNQYSIRFRGQTFTFPAEQTLPSNDQSYYMCIWGGGENYGPKCLFTPGVGT